MISSPWSKSLVVLIKVSRLIKLIPIIEAPFPVASLMGSPSEKPSHFKMVAAESKASKENVRRCIIGFELQC